MHYCVLVVGSNPEKLLEPFEENGFGTVDKKYLEFVDKSDNIKSSWEKLKDQKEYKGQTYEEFRDGHEYERNREQYGYWHNPNGKRDRYVFGGRWDNEILLHKDGYRTNQLHKKDLDLDGMRDKRIESAKDRYAKVKSGEEADIWKDTAVLGRTEKEYIEFRLKQTLSVYAVLIDGKWMDREGEDYSKKENWEEEFNKLFESIPDNALLSIYDCHS